MCLFRETTMKEKAVSAEALAPERVVSAAREVQAALQRGWKRTTLRHPMNSPQLLSWHGLPRRCRS
ncbi:hypothetical protein PMI06_009898 [Burkholderia sp. BT03]|nr:hypothetical protein PMI06_009898 [Burkholderia sp. BT03]SKC45774.1 hypothetical protein SAMN06266956_0047 [Paraburkholderia hospita]